MEEDILPPLLWTLAKASSQYCHVRHALILLPKVEREKRKE
jgi:hypothetical protein